MTVSERVQASWAVRRQRYGPSGGNVGNVNATGGARHYGPGAHTHGHRNTYSRHHCRCMWCSEANRQYHHKLKGRRKMAVAEGQGPVRHGPSGYSNHGCRCTDCRVSYYLKDVTAVVILRAHGIARDGNGGFLMVARKSSPYINSRRTSLLMCGQLLPEDFDDDTRITSAQFQHHPPQAWVEA